MRVGKRESKTKRKKDKKKIMKSKIYLVIAARYTRLKLIRK